MKNAVFVLALLLIVAVAWWYTSSQVKRIKEKKMQNISMEIFCIATMISFALAGIASVMLVMLEELA